MTGGVDPHEAAALEAGRLLFARECRFLLGVADPAQLPAADLPEVAFAGRSNVGKSSLVNALTGRSTLARTSNTPGRTQQLNFFSLDDRLRLVDLPGFGYAEAPKALVDRWVRLVDSYLKGRPVLRRVCLLVDARHGLKSNDTRVLDMLDSAAVNVQVILTKADKLRPGPLQARHAEVAVAITRHVSAHPQVLITSAVNGEGVAALRAELAALAVPAKADGGA